MIPPSSLARLVLGYLEEEGMHRTAVTFQQECSDAQKDPFTQYSSLKTILEEYVEIKETANYPESDPSKVISTLWKKLDVTVAQLKYHTMPENKIPKVKLRTCRGHSFRNPKMAKPVWPRLSKSQKHPSPGRQEFVAISNGNQPDTDPPSIDLTLSSGTQNNPDFIVADVSLDQQQPGNKRTKLSVDSSGHNVPISQITPNCSREHQMLQLQNSQTSTFPIDLRQNSFSNNHENSPITSTQKSGSNALVCTCSDNHNSPVDTTQTNVDCTVEVVEERCAPPLMKTSDDVVMQEFSTNRGHRSVSSENDKVEILSKSPKRKGQPPKKRNFSNSSPSKLVPMTPEPDASSENIFDLQQLLDGGNVDIDAAMPLLLDTFLSTPLLQEKLAENINKVVGSTKQHDTATDEISESNLMPASKVDDAVVKEHDESQVPVDDILNLMEADPAFDALFNLLSTDAVKTASPAKFSQAVPACSYSEPVSTAGATSIACSSAEPVSTTSTIPSTSSDNSLSATSVVTESLLLLASSPSKGLTSTTASSLENLHPISPKEVTPEFVHKQHKDDQVVDKSVHSGGPGYVRSLQFQDQQPAAPVGKPKKSKPSKQKRDTSKTTSNKNGRRRSRKLNDYDKKNETGEISQGSSAANSSCDDAGEPGNLSTIDVSAVKLFQSFASLNSNADGNNGNKKERGGNKFQGSSMVQLLQDAAINQQVQGLSTVNQKYTSVSQGSSKKESSLGSLTPASSSSLSSLNGSKSIDRGNTSQKRMPPRQVSLASSVGGRPLLPRPSIQTLAYHLPLQALPQSTPVLSSLASVSLSPSVAAALGKLPSSSSSSTSQASSSPLYSLLSVPQRHLPQQQPLAQSTSTCLQTPPSCAQQSTQSSSSSSHSKQSSLPTSSYSHTPLPPSSYTLQSTSTCLQTLPPCAQQSTQSSSSSYSHTPPPPSSYTLQSSLTCLQTLPPCAQQSTQSSSSSSQTPPPPSSYTLQSSSTYLQTPPPCAQQSTQSSSSSSSHVKQSLSTSYSQPPPLTPSYIPQSSSSTQLAHSQTTTPLSSSSHAKQSFSASSYSQPPLPSSYIPQSSSSSAVSMSVNQPDYFSQAQPSYPNSSHTTIQQNISYRNPSTIIQATECTNKTQIHSQGMASPATAPSPAAMVTVGFQGQYIQPTDSSEPSPTAQNAEECVSGFISGFQGGLSCQSKNQDGWLMPIKSTLSSASLDKDKKDGTAQPKNGKNRKDNEHGIKNGVKQDKMKEARDVMFSGCGSGAEERGHGQKRPAGQDLKENKPKKSKGCKKPKKSKTKSLPKDFDVDKFLSKLHYVEEKI